MKQDFIFWVLLWWLMAGFLPPRPGLDPKSGYAGFMVNEVALEHVFAEYFGFEEWCLLGCYAVWLL
jgi:hypothetical protein